MNRSPKILFFGTPEFAVASLQALITADLAPMAVITAPDRPSGRGRRLQSPAVKVAAEAHHIPVLQPTNLKAPDFVAALREMQPDLAVVVAFRKLPMVVFDMPTLGSFNLHASLLPQYRGAAPINHAIMNGETESGVTTFLLEQDIDTGKLLLQEAVPILPDDNAGSLHDRLMVAGARLVVATTKGLLRKTLVSYSQPVVEGLKTAPKLDSNTGNLANCDSLQEAHHRVRGLSPHPCAWVQSELGKLKVIAADMESGHTGYMPGQVVIDPVGHRLGMAFANGFLHFKELKPEGRRRMMAKDFLNGLKSN